MSFGSVKQLLVGAVLLSTVGIIGCGARDRASLQPRLNVASVIGCGSETDVAANDLASEKLVNEQINAGHQIAETKPTATAKPKRKAWENVFGRKTNKTLSEMSADPFLDDLDKMIAAKPTAEEIKDKAISAEEAFSNTLAGARRDAEALFGPSNGADNIRENDLPTADPTTEADPFGDALLASNELSTETAKAGDDLESAVFGDAKAVRDSDEFDQFLQQTAKPFSDDQATEPKRSLASNNTHPSAFDPVAHPDASALGDNDNTSFEPFRAALREQTPAEPQAPTATEFEPASMEPVETTTVAVTAPAFNDHEPISSVPETPTIGQTEIFSKSASPLPESSMPQEDAIVVANAPVSLPDAPAAVAPEPPTLSVPDTASTRVEVDPFDDPEFFDGVPTIDEDPFASKPELPDPTTPQFRTANRQVVQPQTQEVHVPATATSLSVNQSTTSPVLASDAVPAQKMVLVEPGQWTAWFLIAGLITVALLLFAPGKGR